MGGGIMALKYKIARYEKKIVDGVEVGIIVGIICERTDDFNSLIATAYIDGEIPKDDFSSWPPSEPEINQAIKEWLLYKEPSKDSLNLTRLESLNKKVNKKIVHYQKDANMIDKEVKL